MRVLLLCDDFHHPGEVPIKGMEPLLKKGITYDAIKNASEFDPGILPNYDVVVMATADHICKDDETSWKTDAIQSAFVSYVENGGGLLVTHNGTVPGANTQKLDELIGSRFHFHPADCPVTVQVIKPHPITQGVGSFTEKDEHYHLEILKDDVDILAAGYAAPQGNPDLYEDEPYFNSPAKIAPSVYVRTQGKGRVCMLTPGHHLDVWLNPEFQKLLENAIRWCNKDI